MKAAWIRNFWTKTVAFLLAAALVPVILTYVVGLAYSYGGMGRDFYTSGLCLYADGKKLAEQTGEHIFRFRVPLHGKVELKAVAGDCIDTACFRSVAAPNPSYKLVKTKSKSANWV